MAALAADGRTAAAVEQATVDTIIDRLAARVAARVAAGGPARLDVLVLSGGGQNGAYGAGFLRAWKDRADDPMPTFDLITGISTGTLQSPYALIGTTAALDTLVALYRRSAEAIAPTFDWWFWLRKTGGLVNATRFRRTIEQQMDGPFADQLRTEFAAGRQLAIGTSDFDLGIGRTWDLSREIGPRGTAPTRVHDLLIGATAIPGIFPPIVIDGHVHADGGVIANALPLLDVAGYRRLGERLRARGVSGPVTVRVNAIWNLWTHADLQVLRPSNRKAMKSRGDFLLFWSAQPALIARLHETADAVRGAVPGVLLEVRHTQIPAALATEPGASKLFDGAWMRRLEQVGRERALSAAPWDSVPSAYRRP
ncbi:MAG: patatin-like phospholipase family protein [Gemmatimonadaceae bacterium]|nr:patatin-like phospholipase family protein [Gemmatimonadaceae bacterium]